MEKESGQNHDEGMGAPIYRRPTYKMADKELGEYETRIPIVAPAAEPIYFDETKKREYIYSELTDFIDELDEIHHIYED